MFARDVMTSPVKFARPHSTVTQLIEVMQENNVSALLVVDDEDKLVGIVSKTDLMPHLA